MLADWHISLEPRTKFVIGMSEGFDPRYQSVLITSETHVAGTKW